MNAAVTSGMGQEARDYLADVERELADLPAEERAALLEDLEQHLAALAEEGDDRPVVIRLGSPGAYAEELRSAAGLPPRGAGPTPGRLTTLRGRLDRAQAHPLAGEVRRLLVELRPGWWVLRGYLVVAVPCAVTYGGDAGFPVPEPLGSPLLGFLLVLAAVAASVTLGRQQLPRRAQLLLSGGGALLVVVGLASVGSPSYDDYGVGYAESPVYDQAVGEYPLVSRYGPVTDVLPYAADGTPLTGVLLYDQDGRPLQVGLQEWWADGCARVLRQPLAADGVPVPNTFPQTYVLDAADADAYGAPVQCEPTVDRPEVPLPTFPAPVGTDVSGADVSGTDPSGTDVSGSDVSGSDPSGTDPGTATPGG